ncbi:hypothetical protein RIF29_22461 [Crotalaria pallida]|uniref:Nodulin-like domain-containing protein n=1 Tax=Crotalaria pallida TaxID=3830 RepID=A0AAN9IEH0_CROPI
MARRSPVKSPTASARSALTMKRPEVTSKGVTAVFLSSFLQEELGEEEYHMQEFVYIEAEMQCDNDEAFKGLMASMQFQEMKYAICSLFELQIRSNEISLDMWAHVKSGHCKGGMTQNNSAFATAILMAVCAGGVPLRSVADMKGLTIQVITGRWFVVFVSFLIMAAAGATYMFGLYSPDIKETLGYDQSTLNLLSFFKDLGGNVGVLSGLINEITPPWVVLATGSVLNFFGYFMIWLAVTGRIAKPQVWHMCLFICMGANSQTFANTGALVTCVKNFPQSRGVVIGILKGYVGLSGAIITQLYFAFYYNDTKALILLIAWLPAALSFVFLRTIRYLKPLNQPNELGVFYKFLYISLSLAGFLLIMIIAQKKVPFTQSEYGVSAAVVLFLLLLPLGVVFVEEFKIQQNQKLEFVDPSQVKIETEVENDNSLSSAPTSYTDARVSTAAQETRWWQNIFSPPDRGEDYTILQALFSIDMIILFIAGTCGCGGTLTAIDNLGQIGTSLGYPKASISTFVSLVSIWGYLGRVFSGFVSEHFLIKYKFPRTLMLTLTLLLSCVGHLLIAFDVPNGLYVASVIIGFCFGAQWPLIFAIISELFGLKYYATLYNFGGAASPIGLYVLNVRVTGHLYDKEAMRQLVASGVKRKVGQELNCVGVSCFKLSFVIITAATFFGAIISLVLVARTIKFYKGDIYKRYKDEAEGPKAEMTVVQNFRERRQEPKVGIFMGLARFVQKMYCTLHTRVTCDNKSIFLTPEAFLFFFFTPHSLTHSLFHSLFSLS